MTLSSKNIKRILERHGFVLSRQRGSHQQFVHESTVYGALANVNRQDEWIPSFERKTCGSEGSFRGRLYLVPGKKAMGTRD